ncbi:MAG TPA: hypothetical protein VFG10_03400 [Saprospiraceae bacterium]|nr:hypothetical protein [Saprospiraceae bacterium]
MIIILSTQNYKYPDAEEINKRLNYLQRVIHQPLESDSDIMALGKESAEFMLFSYSYSVYALTNLAVRDTMYTKLATDLIKESIIKVLDNKITSTYGIDSTILTADSLPEYSILYLGHLNLMIGCYRLICSDSSFNFLNDNISKSLFQRYNETEYLNLESYPESIWIPDNTVAIASLKLHSSNTNSNYGSICTKWSQYAKAHYIDNETGVLFSTVDPNTGEPIEEPRGSMLGWSIMFIYQFDSDFAIDLYKNYKTNFSKNYVVLRPFRERYNSKETGMGDVDSGPLFLGYSIPANEFALGNSILAGDKKTARQILRLIGIGAKKVRNNNEIRYKVRFVKMNISPMAEALVLNSLTVTKWTRTLE